MSQNMEQVEGQSILRDKMDITFLNEIYNWSTNYKEN